MIQFAALASVFTILVLWAVLYRPVIWAADQPSAALRAAAAVIPARAPLYGQNDDLARLSARPFVRLIPLPPHRAAGTMVIVDTQVNSYARITPPGLVQETAAFAPTSGLVAADLS
ncbi:MAG: hypothetical protein M1272_05655, partial [Firmicutes bacterium]|nr:hypothetical protein [Bacillota bacterium]